MIVNPHLDYYVFRHFGDKNMLTRKENYLKAIFNQNPEWVPYNAEAVITVLPPVCERPALPGKDIFGCEWLLAEEAEGGTYPANRDFVIQDITEWKSQLKLLVKKPHTEVRTPLQNSF